MATAPHPFHPDNSDRGAGLCAATHFRNQRFKLVPSIAAGPWVARKGIPQKPALLGQKLAQRYWRGECYVETDVHVGSNPLAMSAVGLGRSASRQIVMDMAYVLEGRCEAELPERLIGVARYHYLNVDVAETIVGDGDDGDDEEARV